MVVLRIVSHNGILFVEKSHVQYTNKNQKIFKVNGYKLYVTNYT